MVLWEDNDMDIVLNQLKLWLDGSVITDAVIEFNLYSDSARTLGVTGATGLTMTHISNGKYRCVIPGTASFEAGQKYYGRVTPSGAYANLFEWEPNFTCRARV